MLEAVTTTVYQLIRFWKNTLMRKILSILDGISDFDGKCGLQNRNVYLYSPLNSDIWYFIPWDNDGSLMRPEYKITGFSDQKSWESGVSNYWGMYCSRDV